RLDLERLRAVLRPFGNRAVFLLNTPHNPSGLVLHAQDWTDVLALVAGTGCFLLLDDAYRDFRYGSPPAPYGALLATGLAAVAGSVSKSFAGSGIRLGWLLSPKELNPVAESVHMHMSNCAPDIVQRTAAQVVGEVTADVAAQVCAHYQRKRDMLLTGLAAAGLRTLTPDGGHFVMARPDKADNGRTATDLALAPAVGVVPLPLESFSPRPNCRGCGSPSP
ncbi:MAG: pyridoxal phosphate-dependent aminotransferase, partial [Pseudonocardiaceae bacterium]